MGMPELQDNEMQNANTRMNELTEGTKYPAEHAKGTELLVTIFCWCSGFYVTPRSSPVPQSARFCASKTVNLVLSIRF